MSVANRDGEIWSSRAAEKKFLFIFNRSEFIMRLSSLGEALINCLASCSSCFERKNVYETGCVIYDSNDLIVILPHSGDLRAGPSFPPVFAFRNAISRVIVVELSMFRRATSYSTWYTINLYASTHRDKTSYPQFSCLLPYDSPCTHNPLNL